MPCFLCSVSNGTLDSRGVVGAAAVAAVADGGADGVGAFQLLSPNHNSLVAAFAPPITTNHKIINTVRSRGLIIQSKSTHKSCEEGGSTDNLSSNSNTNNSKISADTYTHHIALKTRNIENAIKFYSLLGFHVETKFISGPAKCAWLIHSNDDQNDNNNAP
eukprot:scaffold50417_cov68-Cyclotella_meneghiniana.AAC.1